MSVESVKKEILEVIKKSNPYHDPKTGEFTSKGLISASAHDVAAHIKAEGHDKKSAYGQFVKHRALKPEISNKEFQKIYDSVSPRRFVEPGKPKFEGNTHTLIDINGDVKKVQVTHEDEHRVQWVHESGMTGGTPRQFIKKLTPIGLQKAKTTSETKQKVVNYMKDSALRAAVKGLMDPYDREWGRHAEVLNMKLNMPREEQEAIYKARADVLKGKPIPEHIKKKYLE